MMKANASDSFTTTLLAAKNNNRDSSSSSSSSRTDIVRSSGDKGDNAGTEHEEDDEQQQQIAGDNDNNDLLHEELARTEKALRESEERYRYLFESMVQGVVYYDADGAVVAANASSEKVLGVPADRIHGENLSNPPGWWKSIKEDGSDFPPEEFPAALALRSGKPVTGTVMGIYHPRDDNMHWIMIDAIPRFRPNESVPYQVYTTFTDLTQQKRFEKEILRAKQRAEEADKLKSAFLANMSHEIRTPLNGIIGNIDLALQNGLAQESLQENLEGLSVARQSGELLLSIIEDILDLSKIEAGQLQVDSDVVFSLRNVVNEAVWLGQTMIHQRKKSIVLETEVDERIADAVCGDPVRLRQVLNNLVSNAVKFTDKGKVTLHVVKLNDDVLEFCVRDSGKGIAREHLESIFEPFRQVDIGNTRKHGGTGLGLTISKKLVELMGGDLRVESSVDPGPDRGTSFYFTVPYIQNPKQSNILPTTGRFSSSPVQTHLLPGVFEAGTHAGKKILVADDDAVSRQLVTRILVKAGYTDVLQAKNGAEAVNLFQSNRDVAVILMDVQMPNMDGLEATKIIRELESRTNEGEEEEDESAGQRLRERRPVPVIAVSAGAMKGDTQRGLSVGMTGYLTKPIDYRLLVETIEHYINGSGKPLPT